MGISLFLCTPFPEARGTAKQRIDRMDKSPEAKKAIKKRAGTQ
jgi:hypothetical protein